MPCVIEASFTPAGFDALRRRDLSESVCVVFDVLRATSTIATALTNGAEAIICVEEISDALEMRRQNPDARLGGERAGLKIGAEQTGGVEFDLGNSPREYTPERVRGKTIVMTTTNGTRALRACSGARRTVAASFLNLRVAADHTVALKPRELWLVCAGTETGAALEDVLAAGAFCELVIPRLQSCEPMDSAQIALRVHQQARDDLHAAFLSSRNACRLLANPALCDDVEFCLRRDSCSVVPILGRDGVVRNAP
jgi:2-phosphosulfolactate phosphatase